ncbi:MAG: rRNA pseudouridine synthase [Treponema sp.]|nr:rRNA pseudouridine synthase [Candidatus Treponema equifaecale]
MERLDKILAHHGFGTRKDVKRLCHDQVVFVNGNLVTDPGFKVDISCDKLVIDGEEIKLQHDLYIMMNKCQDVVCANKDGEHQTVFDLLDSGLRHKFLGGDLHCMGRLDIDTEGLLILTTDGQLTHKLLAPKTHVPKTYAVGLRDEIPVEKKSELVELFKKGFHIDRDQNESEFECAPSELQFAIRNSQFSMENMESGDSVISTGVQCNDSVISTGAERNGEISRKIDCLLTIYEGKFHQVKRMFSQIGNEVVYLKRVKMGNLELDPSIKVGEYRELTEDEIKLLKME